MYVYDNLGVIQHLGNKMQHYRLLKLAKGSKNEVFFMPKKFWEVNMIRIWLKDGIFNAKRCHGIQSTHTKPMNMYPHDLIVSEKKFKKVVFLAENQLLRERFEVTRKEIGKEKIILKFF